MNNFYSGVIAVSVFLLMVACALLAERNETLEQERDTAVQLWMDAEADLQGVCRLLGNDVVDAYDVTECINQTQI